MSVDAPAGPPTGFEPHERRSPVTDPWQPLYSRADGESVAIGLRADDQHCNGRGFVHGGVLASLADNAMGLSVVHVARVRDGSIDASGVTLNLSIDYVSVARLGDWIEFRPRVHSVGRTIGVVDCLVICVAPGSERAVARANATFKIRR